MTSYQDIGTLIDKHRPYGDETTLPDFTQDVFKTSLTVAKSARDKVEVFGALRDFGLAGKKQKRTKVSKVQTILGTAEFAPEDPTIEKDGVFHVMLPGGIEYRITKGIRIPYTYKSTANETVHANIIILFNGSGEP